MWPILHKYSCSTTSYIFSETSEESIQAFFYGGFLWLMWMHLLSRSMAVCWHTKQRLAGRLPVSLPLVMSPLPHPHFGPFNQKIFVMEETRGLVFWLCCLAHKGPRFGLSGLQASSSMALVAWHQLTQQSRSGHPTKTRLSLSLSLQRSRLLDEDGEQWRYFGWQTAPRCSNWD